MKYTFFTIILFLGSTVVVSAQDGGTCLPVRFTPVFFNPNAIHAGIGGPTLTPPHYSPPVDTLRSIFWVHGLSGNLNSLSQVGGATDGGYGASFPARKTYGVFPDYAETGLVAAGNTLITNMLTLNATLSAVGVKDLSQNLIIAHSQGGLAARMAEKRLDDLPETSRTFHGIVTFNTPHQGAQVINSRNAGLIAEFASGACSSVLTGLALKVLDANSLVDFFVNKTNVANGISNLCTGATNAVLPLALKDLFAGASNDYAVGAPVLQDLGSHSNPATRKTAFFGVEYGTGDTSDNGFRSKQLLWRLVSTMPEFVSNSAPFTANADSNLINYANKATATYWAKYEESNEEVFFWASQGFPCNDWWQWVGNPVGCGFGSQYFYQANAEKDLYYKSWLWFNNSDGYWKAIIGALAFQTEPIGHCVCDDPHDDVPATSFNSTEANCPNTPYCDWVPVINKVVRESDGVVLKQSAEGFPGTSGANRLDFANHFQVRNCEQTRTGLLLLFETGAGDKWFKTKVK